MISRSRVRGSLVLAAMWATGWARAVPGQAAGGCNSHGATQYICGPKNAEDLVLIRGTSWVLTSALGERSGLGGFYLIDVRDHSFREFAPDFSGSADKLYAKCPGPPDPKRFAAHGIAIRYRSGNRPEVYAVNHGGRESIEIFDLDPSGQNPRLHWRGCALTPDDVSSNSVTPLPDHGFAVTSFGVRTDKQSMDKIGAGQPSGFVTEWSPRTGWSRIPGTEFSGDNGIVASEDGSLLYIAGWGDEKVHLVSRGKTPVTHRVVPLSGFHPDNIREGPNGALVVAGQAAEMKEMMGCFSTPICTVGSKVVRLDPRTLELETLVDEPGNPDYGGTSGAILVGDEVWLGTFRGNRIARIKLEH